MRPLFQTYPQLADKLKHIDICTLPSPVQHLENFGDVIGHSQIYAKRDDLSGELFGSNKVRTLEFLLAEAHPDGGNVVGGLPGTSMALATNIYANQLNIPLTTTLFRQNHTEEARRNLRYFQYVNANLIQVTSFPEMEATQTRLNQESQEKYGHDAFMMSPNSPIGMCGYLNAVFELKQQIDNGDIPEPDFIYISTGLLGTSAGLLVGLKASGLKTQLVCCNLEQPFSALEAQRQRLMEFSAQLIAFLRDKADDFPDITITEADLEFHPLRQEAFQENLQNMITWQDKMQELEHIALDLSWTARVVLTIEKEVEAGNLKDKTVLYWHTYNSRPYPDEISRQDYKQLPEDFWHYFETDEFELVNRPDFSD